MAASQFSVDPFLEEIFLVVMFLEYGAVVTVEGFDCKGRIHNSGDIVHIEREESEEQLAVILGWGETEIVAVDHAKTYLQRLSKWHGQEWQGRLIVFGHDLTQSQMFEGLKNEEYEGGKGMESRVESEVMESEAESEAEPEEERSAVIEDCALDLTTNRL